MDEINYDAIVGIAKLTLKMEKNKLMEKYGIPEEEIETFSTMSKLLGELEMTLKIEKIAEEESKKNQKT